MKPLCIYHGKCADGFGAAWSVRKYFGDENVEFHAGVYQKDPPEVEGRDVILVDFSYKRPVLEAIAKTALSVLIIDHHKSAAEDLAGFPPPIIRHGWDNHMADVRGLANDGTDPALPRCLFDMERSGAGMTWDYFFPDAPRPELINHIEDRDLWRFNLDGTREIQANVFSYPYDFEVWDRLMETPVSDLRLGGTAIERKHFKDIHELLTVCQRRVVIAGHLVPVASLPYTLTSDAGHAMCQPVDEGLAGVWIPPFAACYWDTKDARIFSLRSDDKWGAMDVSEIAKEFGGGGHKNAAGFQVPRDHELAVS